MELMVLFKVVLLVIIMDLYLFFKRCKNFKLFIWGMLIFVMIKLKFLLSLVKVFLGFLKFIIFKLF